MDKIEEFLLDAHSNGAINEELLRDAVNEALSSGVLEAVEYRISTQDKNNEIVASTPNTEKQKVIVTSKVKDKIDSMLKNAAKFVETDGRAIEMIDRVIGKHVKDFTDPMMMLVDKDNTGNPLARAINDIAKLHKENKDKCNFFNDEGEINTDIITYLNDNTKYWSKLMKAICGSNTLLQSNSISGAGEFAIACMCPDLTMDYNTKSKITNTIPGLVLANNNGNDNNCIEVKNLNGPSKDIVDAVRRSGARISLKNGTPEDAFMKYTENNGCILVITTDKPDKSDASVFCICDHETKISPVEDMTKLNTGKKVIENAYVITPSEKLSSDIKNRLVLYKSAKENVWHIVPYIDSENS